MKDSGKKALKAIIVILAILLLVSIVGIIASGAAIMNYRSKVPTVTMKHGLKIHEGDTIYIEDVAQISDNAVGYVMGATWDIDSVYVSQKANREGLLFDGDAPHQITVSEGCGQLKVYVSAWGEVHEFTGGETIVTVEPAE